MEFSPLRELPPSPQYEPGDVLVIFGEVFNRGYVNGLIEMAEKNQMQVIYSTVGRRDGAGELRPLTEEELKEKNQNPLINIPLEAGFDLEKASDGLSPVDRLKPLKLTQWKEADLPKDKIEESRITGEKRFLWELS